METIWFCLIAVMIAAYVVFDGFDLGAGIVHFCVARNERERRMVLRSIGPVWDGNEVWLLAAGGTLYFAFPALYASSFSGFYLPLMMVLWLLILRGIAIEFRNHIESPVWIPLWDAVFCGASGLLAIFYGAALGNVVRGVPLDAQGYFFAPLWTNFRLGPPSGILDWYTVIIGAAAFLALTLHGALWIALKTNDPIRERARNMARIAWWCVAAFTVLITVITFRIQPQVTANFAQWKWGFIFPALAVAGLIAARRFLATHSDGKAFLASCAYLVGMLTSVVFGVYPNVLPANSNPAYSLTVFNAKAPDYGLKIGFVWWTIGMVLVAGYVIFVYRHFAGKVELDKEGY